MTPPKPTLTERLWKGIAKPFVQQISKILQKSKDLGLTNRETQQLLKDKISRPWHLNTVIKTNFSSMENRARFEKQIKYSDYLKYVAIRDNKTRPEHKTLNNIVLPKDHPFWKTHYPPNGYNCRCMVRGMTKRQFERDGLEVSDISKLPEDLVDQRWQTDFSKVSQQKIVKERFDNMLSDKSLKEYGNLIRLELAKVQIEEYKQSGKSGELLNSIDKLAGDKRVRERPEFFWKKIFPSFPAQTLNDLSLIILSLNKFFPEILNGKEFKGFEKFDASIGGNGYSHLKERTIHLKPDRVEVILETIRKAQSSKKPLELEISDKADLYLQTLFHELLHLRSENIGVSGLNLGNPIDQRKRDYGEMVNEYHTKAFFGDFAKLFNIESETTEENFEKNSKYDDNVKKFVELLEEFKIDKEKFRDREFNDKLDWNYPIKAITIQLSKWSNVKQFQLVQKVKNLIKK